MRRLWYTMLSFLPAPKNHASIISYHAVSGSSAFNVVAPTVFEEHMRILKEEFHPVSLDELARYRAAGSIPAKTVCVTFDDALTDVYANALPALKKYRIPAAIFVPTGHIGSEEWLNKGERVSVMTEDQLHEVAESDLITLGSHSHAHAVLTTLADGELADDFRRSKKIIESITGKECMHIAYPKGKHAEATKTIARKVGFRFGYATLDGLVGPESDDFALPRNGVIRSMFTTQFRVVATRGRMTRARLFGL
ncbi:MAG TPA: polysaccharide deacetylase family protein [Candidatus Paceibacterota bacterium]|nr:polysaccharide deacetylase family protein [Candidatus Paceibacterota bacterium]